MDEERFLEYPSPTKLTGAAAKYISIPASFLFDEDINEKDVATFVFMRVGAGLNDRITFSLPELIAWCRHKPDRHSDGISKKFLDAIVKLKAKGYLLFNCKPKTNAYMEMEFNSNKVQEECQTYSFAVVYLDEIEKIMQYTDSEKDNYFNAPVLLTVFIYFRTMIFRRPNKLRHTERNVDGCDIKEHDIAKRREISPEAYNSKFKEISKEIGIPPRTVAKATSVLEKLGLLVANKSYNVKIANDEFRSFDLIFANAYKREGTFLLDDSYEYSRREIESKERILQQYNPNYALKKTGK